MAKQTIALGAAPNDGTGTNVRAAGDMINDNFDELYQEKLGLAAWSDIASATTTSIGGVASTAVNITGTTTITSFGTIAAGVTRLVKFAAALTLTHNATSLILPAGANITTAAGDALLAISEGSGNWRVLDYWRATGVPPGAAALTGATFTGTVASSSATARIGYATGAGGTVTQATSKSTAVALNRVTGEITLNSASLAAGAVVSFTFNNAAVVATDFIQVSHQSGGTIGEYHLNARATGSGTAEITVKNLSAGALAEAIVIKFILFRSVNA